VPPESKHGSFLIRDCFPRVLILFGAAAGIGKLPLCSHAVAE
jgi:hypothetical protein